MGVGGVFSLGVFVGDPMAIKICAENLGFATPAPERRWWTDLDLVVSSYAKKGDRAMEFLAFLVMLVMWYLQILSGGFCC